MKGPFADRVVLVTGGGTGIGRALSAAFYKQGAKVVIASRDPEHLKKTVNLLASRAAGDTDHGELLPIRVDVRVKDSVKSAVANVIDSWGRVGILINNAGISGQNPIEAPGEEADQKWQDVIDTNLHGIYHMTRACLPHMTDGDRIINISSVLGKFGVPGYTAYCASKHAVVGFTRALAAELAPRGITVNAICPGWVDTAMADSGVKETAARLGITPAEFKKSALDRVPLNRFLRPEEVAPLALYLASPEAAGMTGQALNIEGGATTW